MPATRDKTSLSVKRVWIAAAVVAGVGVAFAAMIIFGWMIDETHFDRPDQDFDRLVAQIDETPGAIVDAHERWVEAPMFSDPTSWIQLTVDEENLPELLATACASGYPDSVDWSLLVQAQSGTVVSLYTDAAPGGRASDTPCPDFGFDAAGLVGEISRSEPGVDVQASIWDNGRFALVVTDDDPGGLSAVLPLVARADAVRAAAGLDPRRPVEINAGGLSVVIQPGEHDRYLDLLCALADQHGVTSFWADGGGIPIDGVRKVQVTAPAQEHVSIEAAISASGLQIADLPVRFIPPTP